MPEGIGTIYDYDELVRVIEATIHRRDLSTRIPSWIAATELELYRECNVRPADQILTGTFVGGEAQIDLPYGTHRVQKLELNQGDDRWTPEVVSLDRLADYIDQADGRTRAVVIWGDSLQLAPPPEAGITYRMFYYGLPAPLSRANKTSRLFEMGWDAYLYGALSLASAYMGDDERIPVWAALAASRRDSLKRAVWRSRAGGGTLATRPDFQMYDRHTEESSI
jgi:hypothetical protein